MTEPRLPLFYRRITALEGGKHDSLRLNSDSTYKFAESSNSVPLAASEFAEAARDYPIVFSISDPIVPVAIVGLKPDRNLFVGADGNWDKDVYIPAYIRRYPFVLVENSEAGKLVLCCDDSADHFKPATGAAPSASLFEDGKPTALANRIMTFCTEFQQHYQAAIALCRLLSEYELLVSRRADVALNNGEKLALEGFQMVDEDRLRSLRDEKFLELRHKGVLPLIYTHLASATNWRHLVNRLPTGERPLN